MASTPIARRLRRDQTPAEHCFWKIIESYRSDGWHFRRQSPVGPYIVDFVCKRANAIFEIDGDSHYWHAGIVRDAVRTAYLEGRGYIVVRFTNLDVTGNPEGVWHQVGSVLAQSKSTPT